MDYSIHTDIKYGPLEIEDIGTLADSCTEPWWNQSLSRVNDCVIRLGIFNGEFHWHKHDAEDEYFYVIEGRLLIDLEEQTVELLPRQGIMVPKGTRHRTRAPLRTVVFMIEAATITPTGN
jgi:mannose-6-phosphate isomerase-like protein (cupin superfamily)